MKTQPWTPPAHSAGPEQLPEMLQLSETLYYEEPGQQAQPLRPVSAMYMAVLALRSQAPCRISRDDGQTVFENGVQGATARQEFLDSLYLLEAVLTQQFTEGMEEALRRLGERVATAEQARDNAGG